MVWAGCLGVRNFRISRGLSFFGVRLVSEKDVRYSLFFGSLFVD